jgi:hypothetical protein
MFIPAEVVRQRLAQALTVSDTVRQRTRSRSGLARGGAPQQLRVALLLVRCLRLPCVPRTLLSLRSLPNTLDNPSDGDGPTDLLLVPAPPIIRDDAEQVRQVVLVIPRDVLPEHLPHVTVDRTLAILLRWL